MDGLGACSPGAVSGELEAVGLLKLSILLSVLLAEPCLE